jgi:hypothetical protein
MTEQPDLESVMPLDDYIGQYPNDEADIRVLFDEATRFLQGQRWLKSIEQVFVGNVFPGIVGIFLVRVSGTTPKVAPWTWVLVGDLPPAYIAAEDCTTPAEALEGYLGEMRAWVDAVKAGAPVDRLIPVNAPADAEHAGMLDSRLGFLEKHILPMLGEDAAE